MIPDDGPDIPVTGRYAVPQAGPLPAQARPGPVAPHPPATDDEWDYLRRAHLLADDAIRLARSVIRLSPNPLNEAAWPRVRMALDDAIADLAGRDDPESARRLALLRTLHRGRRA